MNVPQAGMRANSLKTRDIATTNQAPFLNFWLGDAVVAFKMLNKGALFCSPVLASKKHRTLPLGTF